MSQIKIIPEQDPEVIALIARGMHKPPKGKFQVVSQHQQHGPEVVMVYPLLEGRPFPNLYWLCSPRLKKLIDQEENRGRISELQSELDTNLELRDAVLKDHQRYIKKRWNLLKPSDLEQLPESMEQALKYKGIGGIADFSQVRCLHMHMAQYLVEGNALIEHFLERTNPMEIMEYLACR